LKVISHTDVSRPCRGYGPGFCRLGGLLLLALLLLAALLLGLAGGLAASFAAVASAT